MKKEKVLGIVAFSLTVVLVSLVSFIGIYTKDKNKMINILPKFMLSRAFTGSRVIRLEVDVGTELAPSAEITSDISDEDIPEEGVPEEDIPGEDIPEEDVPEEGVPDEGIPNGDVPGEDIPQGDAPDEDVETEPAPPAEMVPVNPAENLTEKNYVASKNIIEKRMVAMGSDDYIIRQDRLTGDIIIELPENAGTDNIASVLTSVRKV